MSFQCLQTPALTATPPPSPHAAQHGCANRMGLANCASVRALKPMTKPAVNRPAHRGNKAALPSKPCVVCGLAMSWRRSWAKNWAEVKYCSEACRRQKDARG